jgi:hypothetical protein
MNTAASPKAGFTGWLRKGRGRWCQVAIGSTYQECLAALLAVPSAGPTDRMVLASGGDPNRPPGARENRGAPASENVPTVGVGACVIHERVVYQEGRHGQVIRRRIRYNFVSRNEMRLSG